MKKRIAALALLLTTLIIGVPNHATAAEDCARFAETGQSVCGIFLAYWQSHGGLAQQGFPLSGAFNERSTIDNRYYVNTCANYAARESAGAGWIQPSPTSLARMRANTMGSGRSGSNLLVSSTYVLPR